MARTLLALLAVCILCGPAGAASRAWAEHVTNPWFPLKPGTTFVYTGEKDGEGGHDIVTVTNQTKVIDGGRCTAVSDRLYVHGRLAERTTDWYAQDARGSVWYFGEATAELDKAGHVTSREGTWQAGVDGNLPGLALPAEPKVGMSYREEYSKGVAEDQSRVLALDGQAEVPAGHYKDVLMTEDFSPIEPKVSEVKFYAKGSGQAVLAVDVSGGSDMEQLVKYTH